ncbi:hypothetical protein IPZ60_11745 [Psychrobacter sp. NG25]|uniref:hypothetical protein n=1 Tax=Psychrobacter sp. NG25 TaxID=2782005 RepID=UPI0018839AF2|nr:hypothetical protein [Psychrobacter sp. NG25]MBF0659414.1 hypothetical protein [Psychrobacter sp. NG25]
MSEGIVNNNPKKELLYTLGGIALFLGIVLLIGVSGFLRPAGQHITVQTAEELAAAAPADETAPAETDTAADATVTPATDAGDSTAEGSTDSAVVTAEAGTATASGTVSQTAVADADLTAEQADGDLEAGDAADDTAAAQ